MWIFLELFVCRKKIVSVKTWIKLLFLSRFSLSLIALKERKETSDKATRLHRKTRSSKRRKIWNQLKFLSNFLCTLLLKRGAKENHGKVFLIYLFSLLMSLPRIFSSAMSCINIQFLHSGYLHRTKVKCLIWNHLVIDLKFSRSFLLNIFLFLWVSLEEFNLIRPFALTLSLQDKHL